MLCACSCPGAAAAWTKQAKDTAVRFIHGAPLASAPSAHNLMNAAMHLPQAPNRQPEVGSAPVPQATANRGKPPKRNGSFGEEQKSEAANAARSDDAWTLLSDDGPSAADEQAQQPDIYHKASVGPGGVGKRGKQARALTPPRNLFEIAGLTGAMRGQGYELLLAEGIVGSGATGELDVKPFSDTEAEEGKRSGSPHLTINTDVYRVAASASNLLQPGSPFMRGITGKDAYFDGEEASPRSTTRRVPLVRHFSLSEADLLANTLMPPEQQAKVQAQTILSYMTILERRVQQLAAEFDAVVVTSRGSTSQFGVRGPRVEHDKDRHTFHVEVRARGGRGGGGAERNI